MNGSSKSLTVHDPERFRELLRGHAAGAAVTDLPAAADEGVTAVAS
jgi:hypothetical protein